MRKAVLSASLLFLLPVARFSQSFDAPGYKLNDGSIIYGFLQDQLKNVKDGEEAVKHGCHATASSKKDGFSPIANGSYKTIFGDRLNIYNNCFLEYRGRLKITDGRTITLFEKNQGSEFLAILEGENDSFNPFQNGVFTIAPSDDLGAPQGQVKIENGYLKNLESYDNGEIKFKKLN